VRIQVRVNAKVRPDGVDGGSLMVETREKIFTSPVIGGKQIGKRSEAYCQHQQRQCMQTPVNRREACHYGYKLQFAIHELMRVSFPQAAGYYDKIVQFPSIKHHLKPTWITVCLPEDKKIHHSPLQPLQSQIVQTWHHFIYLFIISGIYMIF
jgi:hypothetical protein